MGLGLTGEEVFCVGGLARAIATGFASGREVKVEARRGAGETVSFRATVRIDTPQEVLYRHGGILQYVLRQLLSGREKPEALSGGLATGHVAQPGVSPSPEAVEESVLESFPASDPPISQYLAL